MNEKNSEPRPQSSVPEELQDILELEDSSADAILHTGDNRHRNRMLAIAASVLILLGIAIPSLFESEPPPVPVTARQVIGTVLLTDGSEQARQLAVGDTLLPGMQLTVTAGSLVALQYADYDLRLNQNSQLLIRGMQPQLLNGEAYFEGSIQRLPDEETEDYRARHLVIDTGQVRIRHVGRARFTVQRSGEQLIASVGEGGIMVGTDHTELMLEALETHNHQVEMRAGKAVRWNTVEKPDPRWRWARQLDPATP